MTSVVYAASSTNSGGGSFIGLLLPALLVVLLLVMMRSSRKRQQAAAATQQSIHPGVTVLTTAGLYATVEAVTDDVVILEIAPGIQCRYARAAIARVVSDVSSGTDVPGAHEAIDPDEADPSGTVDIRKEPPQTS